MLSPRFCHIIVLVSLGAAAFAEESINAERNHKVGRGHSNYANSCSHK